jgi:hypothetical protein
MGIINPEHAPAAGLVQRDCIADAVRPIDVGRYALCDDLDPEATADFCEKPSRSRSRSRASSRRVTQ